MPFLKNDGTVVTETGVTADTNYDYNLAGHNSYGLSIQLVYTNTAGFTATAEIQVSNDGTNFVAVTGTLVSITADGSTIWDLSNSAFKIARIAIIVAAGSADLTLVYNSLNLA